MNENLKTIVFVAAALVVVAAAWAMNPVRRASQAEDLRGKLLVEDFDPQQIGELTILRFDDKSATMHPFQIVKTTKDGKTRWAIPSHDDYPTDAKDQFAKVATGFLNRPILDSLGEKSGTLAEYDLLDPDPTKLRVGDSGVGTRVTIKDDAGKPLVDLIIGKPVDDNGGPRRYVRLADDDRVLMAALPDEVFQTDFGKWIEPNLLKIESFDIDQVWVQDYTVDPLQGAIIQHSDFKLRYDDAGEPRWKLLEDQSFVNNRWVSESLGANEELNAQKLDDMRFALDDLKIVDVRPKPAGLSANLKAAGDFTNDEEAVDSLAERGFYVAKVGNEVGVYSNQGETRLLMKDGVEYVLRFGGIAMDGDSATGGKDEAPKGDNRYLFVMAQFNADAIAKPELTPLPELPAAGGEAAKPEATANPDAAAPEGAAAAAPAGAKAADADALAEAKARREQIEKENQRKQDDYEAKLKRGREHADELNERFANWYYVISNDVYRKIHLSRAEIVQPKKPAAQDPAHGGAVIAPEGNGPLGQFNALRDAGLEGGPMPPSEDATGAPAEGGAAADSATTPAADATTTPATEASPAEPSSEPSSDAAAPAADAVKP